MPGWGWCVRTQWQVRGVDPPCPVRLVQCLERPGRYGAISDRDGYLSIVVSTLFLPPSSFPDSTTHADNIPFPYVERNGSYHGWP